MYYKNYKLFSSIRPQFYIGRHRPLCGEFKLIKFTNNDAKNKL